MATATLTTKTRKPRIWTEEEYLDHPGGCLIEFDHGRVERLPMPDEFHQSVSFNLQLALHNFVRPRKLGKVLAAPLPVKVSDQKYREPDVVFRSAKAPKTDPETAKFWDSVTLAIEIMSRGSRSRTRDQVEKRKDYADAGIAEYWIVDLKKKEITVLNLRRGEYVETAVYRVGDMARSSVLSPFEISVESVFSTE
jgi:Uma2 family endonuclease